MRMSRIGYICLMSCPCSSCMQATALSRAAPHVPKRVQGNMTSVSCSSGALLRPEVTCQCQSSSLTAECSRTPREQHLWEGRVVAA